MATDTASQDSHRAFSVAAHNQATDVLYSDNPSDQDISGLIELAHVAHWHRSHRADILLGDLKNAEHHLETASEIAETVPNPQAKGYLQDQITRIALPD